LAISPPTALLSEQATQYKIIKIKFAISSTAKEKAVKSLESDLAPQDLPMNAETLVGNWKLSLGRWSPANFTLIALRPCVNWSSA
jgi:hypothetical protein